MSDTPPDQKEAGGAPEAARNPWVGWLVWVTLAPALYVLSAGPVWWLHKRGFLPKEAGLVYLPISELPDPVGSWVHDYYIWWTP